MDTEHHKKWQDPVIAQIQNLAIRITFTEFKEERNTVSLSQLTMFLKNLDHQSIS